MWCGPNYEIVRVLHCRDVSVYVWNTGIVTAYIPSFIRFENIKQAKEAFYPMADSAHVDFEVTDFLAQGT